MLQICNTSVLLPSLTSTGTHFVFAQSGTQTSVFVKISPFVLLLQKCNKLYLLDLTQYYDANYGYSSVAFPQQAKSNCLYIYASIVGLLVVTAIGYWTCGASLGKGFNPCCCTCCCCCCCTRCIGSCCCCWCVAYLQHCVEFCCDCVT